ncbi:MAG: mechanosensitive ion channel [Alphaproteobacteria bacterium]|nr:mechanosensitive ion channel [Alphaproteobacteria bacterium]
MKTNALTFPPDWPALLDQYSKPIIDGALNVVAALVILILGMWVAGIAAGAVRRASNRHPRFDVTLASFFSSIVRYAILAFVVVAVLNRFGVQTTSIIAVLGAAALAVGLALQGTLSNLAAGVMLVFFRPYRVGDFVETGGRTGTVYQISLFVTELTTLENIRVVLPNGLCWGAPIVNYTINDTRRTDLLFSISYESDIGKAMRVIQETLGADARVFKEPAPFIKVRKLGDFSVDILTRFWTKTDDFWDAQLDLTKAVKEAFDREDINIPYPTALNYEVHRMAEAPKP